METPEEKKARLKRMIAELAEAQLAAPAPPAAPAESAEAAPAESAEAAPAPDLAAARPAPGVFRGSLEQTPTQGGLGPAVPRLTADEIRQFSSRLK